MRDYQRDFIRYAIHCGVLRFGRFTLKSGRNSPYFFNTGLFDSGARLARMGRFYAQALLHSGLKVDVLYGPAYKGIPLVSATAIALADNHDLDLPFAFNRKEVKDHGEGGQLVGAPLRGSVLILDDVISAGLSIGESVAIIQRTGAAPCGVLIALDRQEKGQGNASAIAEIRERYDIPVYAIVSLTDIITFLAEQESDYGAELSAIKAYQAIYGIEPANSTPA